MVARNVIPRFLAGIDPGVTSGCCLVRVDAGELTVVEHKQLTTLSVFMQWMAGNPVLEAMIVEDYLGSGHRHKPAIHTIQVIGAIKGWVALNSHVIGRFILHPPQWRKPFVKQARELLGVKHGGRHAADALAHIMSYEYRRERNMA